MAKQRAQNQAQAHLDQGPRQLACLLLTPCSMLWGSPKALSEADPEGRVLAKALSRVIAVTMNDKYYPWEMEASGSPTLQSRKRHRKVKEHVTPVV